VCIYSTSNRLQYLVGEQTYSITHIDAGYYLLGYIARDGRVYLADKDVNVISYALSLSVVEYQTVVLRGDMDAAEEMLATIPAEHMPKISRFLEGQGNDPDKYINNRVQRKSAGSINRSRTTI
jgi:coatomer subunit beta'